MKSAKNLVLTLLVLTTVGGALLAWRQHRELAELRDAAMDREERARLQKQLWDLQKANRELEDRLAAIKASGAAEAEAMIAGGERGERPEGREGGRGVRGPGGRGDPRAQMNVVRDLLAKPEVQALLSIQQKAAIEQNYAALFRNLNLTPEQAEKLKTLLAERQATRMDVFEAARSQGIDPRENPEAFRKLLDDARNEVNTAIKSVLGESGFAQLQTYEQTMPQRNLVNELQQRLSYGNTPLTSTQAEQLVQILATNQPPRSSAANTPAEPVARGDGGPRGPGGRGGEFGGTFGAMLGGPGGPMVLAGPGAGGGGASAPITQQAVAQAQSVLSTPQVAALQQMQQQQQAQQQIRQLVNDTLSASGAGGGAGPRPRPPGGK